MYPEAKDDVETMTKQLQGLSTESLLSEMLKEELKPVKADIGGTQKVLNGIKEGSIVGVPGPFHRTMAYTNEMHINSKISAHGDEHTQFGVAQSENTMSMPPARLQPDGTLPWNTRVRAPNVCVIVALPVLCLRPTADAYVRPNHLTRRRGHSRTPCLAR